MDDTDTTTESGTFQIVMFELCGEAYGIRLDSVQEVLRVCDISRVPQAPDFIEGVIHLRGFVIPIIDPGMRFGLGVVERTKAARIIIIEFDDQILGMLVDRVMEVADVEQDAVEPPSALLRGALKTAYLVGFTEINETLIKLLDLEKIFSLNEITALRKMNESDEELEGGEMPDGNAAVNSE